MLRAHAHYPLHRGSGAGPQDPGPSQALGHARSLATSISRSTRHPLRPGLLRRPHPVIPPSLLLLVAELCGFRQKPTRFRGSGTAFRWHFSLRPPTHLSRDSQPLPQLHAQAALLPTELHRGADVGATGSILATCATSKFLLIIDRIIKGLRDFQKAGSHGPATVVIVPVIVDD